VRFPGVAKLSVVLIIQILDHNLGSKWNVLCPFGVGRSKQKARPVIVVHVDPMTCANWSKLVSETKATILKHAQDYSIEVEIFPGDLFMLQSEEVSFTDRINLPVMGHSIGIVGERNAGTLGGYFTLKQNNMIHKGLLTNYHVVRPSDLSSEIEETLDRFGCSLSQPLERALQIESLATIDRDVTILNIDQRLEAMNHQPENLSIKIEAREQIGARPLPTLQRTVEQCEAAISELGNKRRILQQMSHLMGKVTAVSGKAILGRKLMDWAFVQLTDTAADIFQAQGDVPRAPGPNALAVRSGSRHSSPRGSATE
jgi:hypothetical protein